MYQAMGGKKAGTKLRDWPVIATLPDAASAESARPDCWAEIELTCPNDRRKLQLRRSYGKELELSNDGVRWAVCTSLVQAGIAPLDLQLSLLAPTVFGRVSIEEAEDTRSLLSLMLGFDDLEQLGDLASNLARNRTILDKVERATLDTKLTDLKRDMTQLVESLPDAGPGKNELVALAKLPEPSVDAIEEVVKKLDSALATAETRLAKVLGLKVDEGRPPAGIADQLTVAVAKLKEGVWTMFPSLNSIRLDVALPASDDVTSEQRLAAIRTKLEAFVEEARLSIGDRAKWWEKERTPGSKVGLLLSAAEFYDDQTEECPVCERPIEDDRLKEHLESLKHLDPKMRSELRTFFADLSGELSKILPSSLAALGEISVSQAVISDWEQIRSRVLGTVFSELAREYDPKIYEVAENVDAAPATELTPLPEDIDEEFRSTATGFVERVNQNFCALSILEWGVAALQNVAKSLDRTVTAVDTVDPLSLHAALSKGKDSANAVKPLATARSGLIRARKSQESIDAARERLRQLKTLTAPLDSLKILAKYAESEVRTTFDAIRDATIANLNELYPGSATGMKIGRLKLGRGRDKSIESLLSNGTYEVPGQLYANAGLQRAVALSFYFALLQKHQRSLGFILMDDPILSLDEDHRELWSSRLLRPVLSKLQVVLATHQKQYLDNCRVDFSADRIVELNPRDRNQRVSWHPGDRLDRAEERLSTDWRTVPTTMRKFREDVLISLDAYSPAAFFKAKDLSGSLKRYAGLTAPNPLAGAPQRRIVAILQKPAVERVLDPGSHSMTEEDVTKPMAEECLAELRQCQTKVDKELERLEIERKRALRGSIIPATIIEFARLPNEATWDTGIELRLIGAAAAKSDPWVIDVFDESQSLTLLPGAGVLVSGETLDPVAKWGQWALLAREEIVPNDGDLVAVNDAEGNRYLRRIWSDGDRWILQSVNPVHPLPSILVAKRETAARKVIGVLYEPAVSVSPSSAKISEWLPSTQLTATKLAEYHTIEVEGDSLRPLAWPGQYLLVDEQYGTLADVPEGALAVTETTVESKGNVVKRVFPQPDGWLLVSPNPVDTIAPDVLSPAQICSIRPVRGVLFETAGQRVE